MISGKNEQNEIFIQRTFIHNEFLHLFRTIVIPVQRGGQIEKRIIRHTLT